MKNIVIALMTLAVGVLAGCGNEENPPQTIQYQQPQQYQQQPQVIQGQQQPVVVQAAPQQSDNHDMLIGGMMGYMLGNHLSGGGGGSVNNTTVIHRTYVHSSPASYSRPSYSYRRPSYSSFSSSRSFSSFRRR